MKESIFKLIVIIVASLVLIFEFLYIDPIGIKIGYMANGGYSNTEPNQKNADELLRDYKEQLQTYDAYKNSTNPTAQKWAKTALQKANDIAETYNNLKQKDILKKIGE